MPALTAANLLAWSVQIAALVVVAGAAVRAARLQSPRARLASFRIVLVVCLALPFLQHLVAPTAGHDNSAGRPGSSAVQASVSTEIATGVDVTSARASSERAAGRPGRLPIPGWVVNAALATVGAGAAARFAWLGVGLVALARLRRRALPVGSAPAAGSYDPVDRAIDLAGASAQVLSSPAVKHPVTFGFFRPVVLLPESCATLDEGAQVAVVCHELLHVRRLDWLHIVAEEIVRGVLWFNPAIWWLLAQIDLGREQVVDQEVVALTERRQPYLNALVALAMTSAGPVLRPASPFLGRAHLLQRVALLSREVRMSRPRLVVSVALIAAALACGGQFIVQAFPLTAAASAVTGASAPAPAAFPVAPPPSRPPAGVAVPTGSAASPQNEPAQPPKEIAQGQTAARVVQRVEPVVIRLARQSGDDLIFVAKVTVQPSGEVSQGPMQFARMERKINANGGGAASTQDLMSIPAAHIPPSSPPDNATAARAAIDAVRMWRFEPTSQPFTTVIGFNMTRTPESGVESAAVRVGEGMTPPAKVKEVMPVYPLEASARGIQGAVILELTIDGAGIPVTAYAVRSIEPLAMAAVEAALQWRFTPDPVHTRRLVTVSQDFRLAGGVAGGVKGGVAGGVAGGVQGGVPGGVSGGVSGGVPGAMMDEVVPGAPSFGPPPSEWPIYVRVGGTIAPPAKIYDVRPVYPREAQDERVQGVVIVQALIGADGKVQAGCILRSIPMLDNAALDAVRQWEFTPTLLNGAATPVVMTVTVNFTLQ